VRGSSVNPDGQSHKKKPFDVSKLMARNVMQAVRDAKRRASALENDMSTSLSSSLKHHPIKVRPNPNPNPNANPSPVKPLP
jgi:hypothetical protein